ncbi:tetratricopeptide repeat protein [Streptacidiphilus sp. EB103A]|uniref:ATP-binding protein n=1 Tax=Streptacidiphilus sp. EB103A TaxID=3156275 RepID=UPI0035123712
MPRSTLADALNPRRRELPKLEVVLALVRALGGGSPEQERWRAAWKRVAQAADDVRVQSTGHAPATATAPTAPSSPTTPTPPTAAGRNFLPPGPADFTAREEEVLSIIEAAGSTREAGPALLAIDGMAGVGKTALAVHAGHRLAQLFPDGQYYLDLHAHTAGQDPVDPAAALDILLRTHGRSADSIPAGLAERAAAWRAELADHRVLLVIDNAASTEQVRPLLPGSGGSLVLVTSRRRLVSLEAGRSLSLDVLSATDAVLLFQRILGPRAAAEPEAVATLVELCGRLPLAIRIAAARLRHRSSWSVALLVDRLSDERRRLSELATSDLAVAAAFQTSFNHLARQEQLVFAQLGLVPGADVDARAVAALVGLRADDAERSLEELLDAHLVEQLRADRYTLHDLLRIHSAAQAASLPEVERENALRQLFDHYRYWASIAMDAMFPHERNRRPEIKPPNGVTREFTDRAAAVNWLDAERSNLVAASGLSGLPQHAIDLSAILARYLERGAHGKQALVLHERALRLARAAGDVVAEAGALRFIGLTHLQLRDYQSALAALNESMAVLQEHGRKDSLAAVLNNLGAVYGLLGRLDQSSHHFDQALRLSRAQGDDSNEALAVGNLGLIHRRQGRLEESLALNREALDLQRRLGNTIGQSIALDNMGVTCRHLGRLDEALDHHRQALVLDREGNDRTGELITIDNLGLIHFLMGDHASALAHFEEAIVLSRKLEDHTAEGIALGNIGNVLREQGRLEEALQHHRTALELLRGHDNALNLAEALNNLGETLSALGTPEPALPLHNEALELAETCGDPIETARSHDLLGRVQHLLGDQRAARELHLLAREAYLRMGLPQAAALAARACCSGGMPAGSASRASDPGLVGDVVGGDVAEGHGGADGGA